MFESIKGFADSSAQLAIDKKNELMEKHWDTVEKLLLERVAPLVKEKVLDDKTLTPVLEKVYETLTMPVRFVVDRDNFVKFSLEKKNILIEKIELSTSATIKEDVILLENQTSQIVANNEK